MSISDPTLPPIESTLIKWIGSAPGKPYHPRKLETVEWESLTASRAGWVGVLGLGVYLTCHLITNVRQAISSLQLDMVFYMIGHGLLGSVLGFCLLVLIKLSGVRAKPIIFGFSYLAWPLSMAPLAPLDSSYCFAYVGFNAGIAMLCLVPRWQKFSRSNRKGQYVLEFLACLAFPSVLLVALGFTAGSTGFGQWKVLFSSLIAFLAFSSIWRFGRVMAALQHPKDHDGWRTTIIMMCFPWLWLLWLIDSRGGAYSGVEVVPGIKSRRPESKKHVK